MSEDSLPPFTSEEMDVIVLRTTTTELLAERKLFYDKLPVGRKNVPLVTCGTLLVGYRALLDTARSQRDELTKSRDQLAADLAVARCETSRAETECDILRANVAATLRELPVGNMRLHTVESIPERVAELVRRYAETGNQVEHLEAAGTLREHENIKLLNVLRSVEWDSFGVCPACGGNKGYDHRQDCRVDKTLKSITHTPG